MPPFIADDYFDGIAGAGFDVLYEDLNVKKEIVDIEAIEGGSAANVTAAATISAILNKNAATSGGGSGSDKDVDYVTTVVDVEAPAVVAVASAVPASPKKTKKAWGII